MKGLLLTGLLVSLALTFAAAASATPPQAWWTTDHAEAVILDSDWAFGAGVDDANCVGWGAARIDTTSGQSAFHRFVCSAYAQVQEATCLPGECSTTSIDLMCTYRLRIQASGPDTFFIVAVRSDC